MIIVMQVQRLVMSHRNQLTLLVLAIVCYMVLPTFNLHYFYTIHAWNDLYTI